MASIALAGNPNCGKSTIFNALTGLRQKIANYPGVTTEIKVGDTAIEGQSLKVYDLPGSYNWFSQTDDEKLTQELLGGQQKDQPEAIIYIADAVNLKRSLVLFSQLKEVGLPMILVLNMIDIAERRGVEIDIDKLQEQLGVPVVKANSLKGIGLLELKLEITKTASPGNDVKQPARGPLAQRYRLIDDWLEGCINLEKSEKDTLTEKLDKVLVHPIFGFVIFIAIMGLVFQAIFSWASWPMDLIDLGTANIIGVIKDNLGEGALASLLADGVVAGLGGIVIFIPQIALLFFFIAILEDSGYMSRVSYITDRLLRTFGLNGKSIIPLISGMACAVPAVLSARSISNKKERLLTILVTPLMACSARLPVYTLIIALVIPEDNSLGPFNLQGLSLLGLYLLGFLAAILTALIFKFVIKSKERRIFLLDMPTYKLPRWKNIGFEVLEKVQIFVVDAGKIILAISIVLWALASYGPSDEMEQVELRYSQENMTPTLSNEKASAKLEASYAGHLGKFIEPAIRPLGYDWKIGIALITSFAAREVFVGTLATIYSLESEEDVDGLKSKMRRAKFWDTGKPVFTVASAVSLLLFYAFAMQCMSTIAIVRKETGGWKWTMVQLFYMSALAYFSALAAFQLLS